MNIKIRKGTMEDIEAFIGFLKEIKETMVQKEWFYVDPPEYILQMMSDGIMELWVAMDEERMAAAFSILRPGKHEFNYGYDLGLSEEELSRVINMDTAAVHPDYRGMGLQKKLLQFAESELRQEGAHILLCTVHPDNHFSLNNVLQQGYEIQKKLEKYGSVRYVLRKDFI